MNRAGLLIIGAVIVAAAALSAIFFTDALKTGTPGEISRPSSTPTASSGSPEAQLVNSLMNQAATGGGFAVTFSNQDVSNWALTSGHRLERFSIEGQGTVFARLSSTAALNPANLLDGLYVELPEQFTARSNGKAIQVGIVARTARANPAQSFSVIYLTRQAGNSGWQTFSLGAEFQLLTFDFTVPSVPEGYSTKPILSIYGDPAGDGKGVELLGAYVKLKQ